jgi:hypothetical protein
MTQERSNGPIVVFVGLKNEPIETAAPGLDDDFSYVPDRMVRHSGTSRLP